MFISAKRMSFLFSGHPESYFSSGFDAFSSDASGCISSSPFPFPNWKEYCLHSYLLQFGVNVGIKYVGRLICCLNRILFTHNPHCVMGNRFIQVFGEGGSQEQVKGQCAELLKLKTVDDHLRFLDTSPKTCMNRVSIGLDTDEWHTASNIEECFLLRNIPSYVEELVIACRCPFISLFHIAE
jgi:hypothetical protein